MRSSAPKTEIHYFFCCVCGNEGIPIIRRKGQLREKNHKKRLFCVKCQKRVNHTEYTEFEAEKIRKEK